MSGNPIHIFPKKQQILYGLNIKQIQEEFWPYEGPTGMFFMNNGDVFFGTDDKTLSKTGIFVKYGHDGFISIGEFSNGELIKTMNIQEVLDFYLEPTVVRYDDLGFKHEPTKVRLDLVEFSIDTTKKYF